MALLAGPGAAHASASSPAGAARLSDERSYTRSAHALRPAPVHAWPAGASREVGRLRTTTEDGFAETYLALSAFEDARGRDWVRVRLPGRPNGRTGWVLRSALGAIRLTRAALVVDRERLRVTFLMGGRQRWSAPVGIGALGSPTPAGRYWIREKFPVRETGTIYGAYAFGTSAYSALTDWPGGGVVGIHGTNAPELIPGRPSHGCIRLRDEDVLWLARRLPVGAPVLIR